MSKTIEWCQVAGNRHVVTITTDEPFNSAQDSPLSAYLNVQNANAHGTAAWCEGMQRAAQANAAEGAPASQQGTYWGIGNLGATFFGTGLF
jgi:hypothetical protein